MKITHLITLLLIMQCYFLSAKTIPVHGYIVNNTGDTSIVTISVHTSIGGGVAWIAMQNRVKYHDQHNKKMKMDANEIIEYGFTYEGKNFRARSVPCSWLPISGRAFLRLDQDGYCKVYTMFQRGQGGMSLIYEYSVLQKGNGETCLVTGRVVNFFMSSMHGKGVKDFFTDCPPLMKKLEDGVYIANNSDAFKMALYYNEHCAN